MSGDADSVANASAADGMSRYADLERPASFDPAADSPVPPANSASDADPSLAGGGAFGFDAGGGDGGAGGGEGGGTTILLASLANGTGGRRAREEDDQPSLPAVMTQYLSQRLSSQGASTRTPFIADVRPKLKLQRVEPRLIPGPLSTDPKVLHIGPLAATGWRVVANGPVWELAQSILLPHTEAGEVH